MEFPEGGYVALPSKIVTTWYLQPGSWIKQIFDESDRIVLPRDAADYEIRPVVKGQWLNTTCHEYDDDIKRQPRL